MSSSSPTTSNSTPITELAASENGSATKTPTSLRDWALKTWTGLKFGDRALQLDKDARRQMIVERLIKKTQDGTIGKSTDDPWPNDDMAVNVGDTHTNYYQQPAPASSGISTLGKIAVAASLVAGGAGIGTLIPAAIDLLSQDKQPNQAEAPIGQNPDSDTKYGLRLFTDPPTQ